MPGERYDEPGAALSGDASYAGAVDNAMPGDGGAVTSYEDTASAVPVGRWRPNSKKQLEKYERLGRTAVPVKPFTVIAEEAIPPQPEVERKSRQGPAWLSFAHTDRTSDYLKGLSAEEVEARKAAREEAEALQRLDGFMLLESTAAELPDQVTRCVLSERSLGDVEAEDLEFFTRLQFLDLGDNNLRLEMLAPLVALTELRLHCNAIRRIGALGGALERLEVLDLSYNALETDAIERLTDLPNLRELDLTCNALQQLPESMEGFRRLEVLILERNRLETDEALISLSQAPRLRELNLNYNYLMRMPRTATVGSGFRTLEWLNLANNYIKRDTDILPLVRLPRLLQVILYGNPLTDGVDPGPPDSRDGGTAEALNEEETEGRIVNVVTDPPDPKSKIQGRGAYSNFRITKVVDNTIPSATAWREAGNRYLFGESDSEEEDEAKLELQAGDSDEERAKAEAETKKKKQRPPRGDERTTVFMTANPDDDGVSVDSDEEEDASGGAGGPSIPALLLQRSMVPSGEREAGDPARLRAAINALRHALKHPLTSHMDGKASGKGSTVHHMQTTALQKLRQKPIKPYKKDAAKVATGGGGGAAALSVTRHHLRGVAGGVEGEGGGTEAIARATADTEKSLAAMEGMLERMNGRMVAVEGELSSAMEQDKSMSLLMDMVGKVMSTYE